jgi:hypothetical protein
VILFLLPEGTKEQRSERLTDVHIYISWSIGDMLHICNILNLFKHIRTQPPPVSTQADQVSSYSTKMAL